MRHIGRWLLVAWLGGCAGAPPEPAASAPAQAPSQALSEPASHGGAMRSVLNADDEAFVVGLAPFLASVTSSAARCHALFDPLTAESVRAQGLPFDDAKLNEACGEAGSLYDAALKTIASHDRSTDVLLTHLARVADDLDYTRRTLQESVDEQVNARKHVHDALAATDAAVLEWNSAIPMGYTSGAAQPDPGMWSREVENDGHALPMLRMLYGQLAFNQGFSKEMVRRRMLDSFLRVARRPVEARKLLVQAPPDPAERAARQAYLDACTHYLDVYTSVLDAFVQGRVPDQATYDARVADADQALAEFKRVWELEHARVGGTGG